MDHTPHQTGGTALLAISPNRLWALIEAHAPAGLVKLVPRPTKG